jgi:hypothetical protein
MAFFATTYHSRLYRAFKGLEDGDHQGVIRFFEREEEGILKLAFNEYYEILMAYCDALFETAAYRQHILMGDVVIELTMRHNVHLFEGRDVFRHFLFRKAAALYNLFEGEQAEHILKELMKMDPSDREAIFLYSRCRQRRYPGLIGEFRALSILLFLISACIIAAEILFVIPFYTQYAYALADFRTGVFFSGVCVFFTGNVVVALLARRDTRRFLCGISPKQDRGFF